MKINQFLKINRWTFTLILVAAWSAAGQTAVDLTAQGKLGTGATLPARCTVGQVFFNTAAPSGANLYTCTTPNHWVAVGMPSLGGDASGTQQTLTVKGLQGRPVSSTTPTDQNILRYNASTSQWEPGTLPAIGTGAPPANCAVGNLYLRNDTANNLQQLYICANTNTWTMTGAMNGPVSQRPANCVAGQTWISTDTAALSYCTATGTPGNWAVAGGAQGPAGPQGPVGPSGNAMLNGAGAPPATSGSNGDLYLDTAAACLYGPKAGAAWPQTCTTLTSGANFNLASGTSLMSVNYSPQGLNQSTVEPTFGFGGNLQTGVAWRNWLSGLRNPADYGNLAGLTMSSVMFNGHNQTNNNDKKTMFGINMYTTFLGGGQRFGLGNVVTCPAVGDCFGSSNVIQYSQECPTAGGDECVKGTSDQILQNYSLLRLPTTSSAVKSSCGTTFAESIVKSAVMTDVKTWKVASTAGCAVGDWVTLSPGIVDGVHDAYEEVVQLTAVGAGSCPGSNCTLSALLQSPHASGEAVTFSVVLPIPEQGGFVPTQLGQGKWVVNLSSTPYATGTINYNFASQGTTITGNGTSWGASGGSGPLAGGTPNVPGCIAIAQDIVAFNNDALPVSGISNANPAVLTLPNHPFTPGTVMPMILSGATGANWSAIDKPFFATVIDGTHISVPVDSRSWGALTGTVTMNTAVFASFMPVLSVNSATSLQVTKVYHHAASGSQGANVAYAWFPCGRQFTNMVQYNTSSNPPNETVIAVGLEANGFIWKSGDTVEFAISPYSTVPAGYQVFWNQVGPQAGGPDLLEIINGGYQMAQSVLRSPPSLLDTATKAGFVNGLTIENNVAGSYLSASGKSLNGRFMVAHTFNTGGIADSKAIEWQQDAGSIGNGFIMSDAITGYLSMGGSSNRVRWADYIDHPGYGLVHDYSAIISNSTTQTVTWPNASGTVCLSSTGCGIPAQTVTIPDQSTHNAVNIGTFSGGAGAFGSATYNVAVCTGVTYPVCKQFVWAGGYNGDGSWTVAPFSERSPDTSGFDYVLDVTYNYTGGTEVVGLRLRATGAPVFASAFVTIGVGGMTVQPNFTPDGAQVSVSVPGSYWSSAVLTQRQNQVGLPGAKTKFASLGSVPASGTFVYCVDCTTAPTCAGAGSGHMAVSNGAAWTCQ